MFSFYEVNKKKDWKKSREEKNWNFFHVFLLRLLVDFTKRKKIRKLNQELDYNCSIAVEKIKLRDLKSQELIFFASVVRLSNKIQ